MLWVWFITAIVLLAIVVLLLRWLSQPIAYRRLLLTDTRRFLQSFLQQSGAGSILVLDRESGPGFLQIAIGKRQRDQLEIEFGVPDAAWSRQHFDIVHGAMGNAGFINRVETNSDNENIPRFLRVYVRGNRDELSRVVPQVLELAANALGFRMGDRYTLRMSGAVSSEYQRELAAQLEQLPRGGHIGRMIVRWLRRSAGTGRQR